MLEFLVLNYHATICILSVAACYCPCVCKLTWWSLTAFSVRPYIVYMLRESEIREDWAAITIALKQSQDYLRHHDGG